MRVLLAMEDGGCRLPDQIQDRAAGFGYEKHPQAETIQHRIERFISLGFVERVGGSEYCITPDGRRVLNDIRQNPGSHYEAIRESSTQNAKAGSSSQIIQAGRDVSLIKRDR
jgi:predicted transcriptional regulator